MKRIEKLTRRQEQELPQFRQRYLDMACNGKRIDRAALETALAQARQSLKSYLRYTDDIDPGVRRRVEALVLG